MKTPFSKRGKIVSPLRAILDRCIVWPIPAPDRIGVIELTDSVKKLLNPNLGTGVLLSVGPGYKSINGKFHGTTSQLVPGVVVKYDKTVPWRYDAVDEKGKSHELVICGVQDIHGVLDD
jgi:hypothetical protein